MTDRRRLIANLIFAVIPVLIIGVWQTMGVWTVFTSHGHATTFVVQKPQSMHTAPR